LVGCDKVRDGIVLQLQRYTFWIASLALAMTLK
jgi:hypothetical protein